MLLLHGRFYDHRGGKPADDGRIEQTVVGTNPSGRPGRTVRPEAVRTVHRRVWRCRLPRQAETESPAAPRPEPFRVRLACPKPTECAVADAASWCKKNCKKGKGQKNWAGKKGYSSMPLTCASGRGANAWVRAANQLRILEMAGCRDGSCSPALVAACVRSGVMMS